MSGALLGPVIGQLIDRLEVRRMMFLGLLGWAASLIGMSFLGGSHLAMLIMSGLMGVTSAICGPISFAKVAGWFDRHRGLALGIVLSAAPAIATAIMVVVAWLTIAEFGWRFSYRAFAAGVVLLGIPTAYFLMHEARHLRPDYASAVRAAARRDRNRVDPQELRCERIFAGAEWGAYERLSQ